MLIEDDHLKNICKVGQRNLTCSFIALTGEGFECTKGTPDAEPVKLKRQSSSSIAIADNCSGPPDFIETKSSSN